MFCLFIQRRKKINWNDREKELNLLKKYRKSDGSYDVLIPGSGGKDSRFLADVIKKKYKMNHQPVLGSTHVYRSRLENFQSWIASGLDNVLFTPNKITHKILTK